MTADIVTVFSDIWKFRSDAAAVATFNKKRQHNSSAMHLFVSLYDASAISKNKTFAMSPAHKFVLYAKLRVLQQRPCCCADRALTSKCRPTWSVRMLYSEHRVPSRGAERPAKTAKGVRRPPLEDHQ
jgi:hypothetical protein